jgi:hypothetical protein
MKNDSKFKFLMLLLLAALAAPLAHADQWQVVLGPTGCAPASCANYIFTNTVTSTATPGTYNLSFTVAQGPGASDAYLQGFGLTLFTGSSDGTFLNSNPVLPAGWVVGVVDNSKFNNGNNGCGNGNQPGSLCITINSPTGNGYLLTGGGSITFNFTVVGSSGLGVLDTSQWHIMSTGSTCASGNNCGNVFALTNNGPSTNVPEPASVLLGAVGLLGVFVRRKFRE